MAEVGPPTEQIVPAGFFVSDDVDRSRRSYKATDDRVNGRHPDDKSYNFFRTFEDPLGNGWVLEQVTARLPGRVDPTSISFNSAADLASAPLRAEAADSEHGHADPDLRNWYAGYMESEQTDQELPQ